MSTHDDGRPPRGAHARRPASVWRVALLAALSALWLGAVPRALAAQEYYDLDAGRPTRLEDATPTARQQLNIEMPSLRLDQAESGPKLWRSDLKVSYGIAAFTEVEMRLPVILVDPATVEEPRTIAAGGLAIGATRALTLETAAIPGIAVTGEWVAPVGGLSARVGSYSAKLLLTKTLAHWRVNLNGGFGTWSVRPASIGGSASCSPSSGSTSSADCSSPPPPPPVVGCVRALSDQASLACLSSAPTTLGEVSRTRSVADTSTLAALSGPRYVAVVGVDHAFALSSTLFIADVVVERYVHLYDAANVTGELGLRQQVTPQLVADVGVSTSLAGPVRTSSITFGLSFDLPMQLRRSSSR